MISDNQPGVGGDVKVVADEHGFPLEMPKTLNERRTRYGVHYLPGVGSAPADIMFVQGYVFDEQAEDTVRGRYETIKVEPKIGKGGAFNTLKEILGTLGVSIDNCYYTSFIKFRPPKGRHNKAPKHVIDAMRDLLTQEVERVKPKIIVAFGKLAFEQITGIRAKFDQIRACWFACEQYNCMVYVMPDALQPVLNPAAVEQMRTDLLDLIYVYEAGKENGVIDAVGVRKENTNYEVIYNSQQLNTWVDQRIAENCNLLSVDGEFGGLTIVDCKVRSIQFCWAIGCAVYIRFMDDAGNYTFDVDYATAGKIMSRLCDRPSLKYIGYAASVDISRLAWVFGLQWFDKLEMDLQTAIQCYDENAEQGLERVALEFTRFGRYDSDLLRWKAENPTKVSDEHGYLYVPDEILIPYALLDVDVPMRAYRKIVARLVLDNTYMFYREYANKLVGNLFVNFMLIGLPVMATKLEKLRRLYDWGKVELELEFMEQYAQVLRDRLLHVLLTYPEDKVAGAMAYAQILHAPSDQAYQVFNSVMGTHASKYRVIVDAYLERHTFKLGSADHKCRWLFDVMGYKPVKSTANKNKGQYAMPWDRVLELPPEVQKQYRPAVDKQTMTIIKNDTGDPLVAFALSVIAVKQIRNSVLKPAERDDNGELVKENGLMYWLAADGRLHCNFALTETFRPRAWKPNTLNLASYVHEGVKVALKQVLAKHKKAGTLPPEFEGYANGTESIPSIRSVVDARSIPPEPGSKGYIFAESDYDTAELVSQANQSGDTNFIRLVEEPDSQFGIPASNKKARVRLRYSDDSGIPESNRRPEFIMTWTEAGKLQASYSQDDLLKNPDGSIKHPRHDLHWSLVELVQEAPRELFVDKIHRTGIGKVGNFSTAYGASPVTLERKYKSDTGKEPEPGTGQRILDALEKQRPVAMQWLRDLELCPVNPGYVQAESGAKRHFKLHDPKLRGISARTKKSILASLAREARNFPLQHSVAASAIRAGDGALRWSMERGLWPKVAPMAILYDSLVTLTPVELRHEVLEMHERVMVTENKWHNHGREWSYTATHELNYAWSERPTTEEQSQLETRN